MHLRKLRPIEEMIAGTAAAVRKAPAAGVPSARPSSSASATASAADVRRAPVSPVPSAAPAPPSRPDSSPLRAAVTAAVKATAIRHAAPASSSSSAARREAPATVPPAAARIIAPGDAGFKDALLAEIRKSKAVLYNMVIAQAQTIEVGGDKVTFTFSPAQKALRDNLEQNRAWLESAVQQLAGRRIAIVSAQADATAAQGDAAAAADKQSTEKKSALREQALADAGVQTMLEVFPAEIRDVEEM